MKLERIGEDRIEELASRRELRTAFAVIRRGDSALLQFNRYRKKWEIPGGMVEPGESARACIVREVAEECGQDVGNARCLGMVELLYSKNEYQAQDEYLPTALYLAELGEAAPFIPNEEVEKIAWWRDADPPPEPHCATSIEFVRLAANARE